MGEAAQTLTGLYRELGALAFLIVAMTAGTATLIGVIVYFLFRILKLMDKLFDKADATCSTLMTHDRQGVGIAEQVGEIHEKTTRIDSNVLLLLQQKMR